MDTNPYDAVIIGGGAASLSAASFWGGPGDVSR